jgi:aminopeptidase N
VEQKDQKIGKVEINLPDLPELFVNSLGIVPSEHIVYVMITFRRFLLFAAGAVLACASCSGGSARMRESAGPASLGASHDGPPAAREDGRLPATAIPKRYNLRLEIDPTQPRFSGTTTILAEVPSPTAYVVLNARDMHVTRALATPSAARSLEAVVTTRASHGGAEKDELVLEFPTPLPAGSVEITIDYDAPFAADLAGLYRVQEYGSYYAYTQFEATDARRAFPCFDEPSFKTPYEVTISAPRGMVALSNTPETGHTETAGNRNLTAFEPSPPLPSYLVAFAVGDFDIVQGQKDPFPIRVVTTKGRGSLAPMALDVAAALIGKLGDYFAMRYPYSKLDLVAVPDFAAGAMENPGLVTFRDTILLVDPVRGTTGSKRSQAAVIAHEFAHQWFGDLVTMPWWDDLWLNEGFATWAEAKMVDAWRPRYAETLEQIADSQGVMDTDSLRSARAVRQPVRSTGEAMEAFDGITYDKGAAVLRMVESWVGEGTFRRGVQRYLTTNAWKNAGASDLFASLDYVSTQSVGKIASAFLDQPGVPVVTATLSCGVSGESKIELRASEWQPLGEPPSDPKRAWTVPVCVATDSLKTKTCFTLGSEPILRGLGSQCPTWIYPNAGQNGYYRFVSSPRQLLLLAGLARSLDVAERVGLLSNIWAGVRSGALGPSLLLEVLPLFDGESSRVVVEQVVGILRGLDQALVPDAARADFRRYVAGRLLPRKRTLGWEPGKASVDDDERALTRRTVLWTLGELARDPDTLREAEVFAARWLKDPTSVSSDTASIAVPLASLEAGPPRLAELRAAAQNAVSTPDRLVALRSMGTFDDPTTLRQALDVTLGGDLKLSELRYVFGGATSRRNTVATVFAWEKDRWDDLRARLAGSLARGPMVDVVDGLCTREQVDDATAFFSPKAADMAGAKRPLDEAIEAAGLCITLREHGEALVASWLSGHREAAR